VERGSVQALEGEFFIGAWSPDGKWLAVTEKGEKVARFCSTRKL